MIQVDYSNEASIKHALTGVDVVISTVPVAAFDVQWKISVAAKEVYVKLFVPSEFGGISEEITEGLDVEKATRERSSSVGSFGTAIYRLLYWRVRRSGLVVVRPTYDILLSLSVLSSYVRRFINLDLTSGKVSVGGDGNKPIPFTSRTDIARYVSYVLTHLPSEQFKNRSFTMAAADTKVTSSDSERVRPLTST